jgi:hypothetical protein
MLCVVPFNVFFHVLPFGLQSALVTVLEPPSSTVCSVLLGSTNEKCFGGDWCLGDIVPEMLLFEGPVRFYLFGQWFE